MKKIDVTDYIVKAGLQELPYKMRDSLVDVLTNRQLKLNGAELLRRNALCMKILDCDKDFFLMEEADYMKLKSSAETLEGFGREDMEFVRRIFEAEDVSVVAQEGKA